MQPIVDNSKTFQPIIPEAFEEISEETKILEANEETDVIFCYYFFTY